MKLVAIDDTPDTSSASSTSTQQVSKTRNSFKLVPVDDATSQQTHDTAMASNRVNPAMQGGANAPALVKARQGVQQATKQSQEIDTPVALAKGSYNATWPVSAIAKTVIGQGKTPIAEPTTGGGKALADVGALVNPLLDPAIRGAGAVLKPVGGVIKEGAKAVGSMIPESITGFAKPVGDRIFNLYKQAVNVGMSKFKIPKDVENYKKDVHSSVNSIIKNSSNITHENPMTGEIYNSPKTVGDFLDAIDQTQKKVWQDKVQAMSQAATDKGAMIDTESLTKKALSKIVNDKNLRFVSPNIVKDAEDMIEQSKILGRQTPAEVEDLLTKLNNKTAVYWANKDKNAVNAFAELAHSLRDKMETTIEDSLEKGGYLDARKEYGAMKAIKKDVLNSAARQAFKGDATIGDKLLDTFAGEELVRGVLTLDPKAVVMSGSTKAYQVLRQALRSPDRKIEQMFDLAKRYAPKATPEVEATYAGAHNPIPRTRPQDISEAQIMAKRLPGLPTQKSISYQTKGLPKPEPEYLQARKNIPEMRNPQGRAEQEVIPIGKVSRRDTARYQRNAPKESVFDIRKEKPDAGKGIGFLTQKAKSSKSMTEFVNSQKPKNIKERRELIEIYKKAKANN